VSIQPVSETVLELGTEGEHLLVEGAEPRAYTQRQLFRRRFFRHRMAMISLFALAFMAFVCYGANLVAPYGRGEQDLLNATQPPSSEHWMGTDRLGRDYLTEILYAGRLTLTIGFLVALISTTMGALMGAVAGYRGGWIDQVISRITDLFLIVPALLIAATLLSGVRRNGQFLWWDVGDRLVFFTVDIAFAMILVIAFLSWQYIVRLVRAQVLALKEREFVEAARAAGASHTRIIRRHILPNCIGVITVNATLTIAIAIVTEATLTFLGFGLQPPNFSWGYLIYDARGTVGSDNAYLLYFPGLMLFITVLSVNFIGDGLRDAFDPHGKKERW